MVEDASEDATAPMSINLAITRLGVGQMQLAVAIRQLMNVVTLKPDGVDKIVENVEKAFESASEVTQEFIRQGNL